jgi:hypothetical protein
MGDYTGLRFRAKLTPHAHMALVMAREVRRSALADESVRYEDVPEFWDIVRSQGIKIPAEFLAAPRSIYIPFGVVCYMPADWGNHKFEVLPEGIIEVVCSLKDFGYRENGKELTVMFCEEVLPLLIQEPCTAEILYEYWNEPRRVEVPCDIQKSCSNTADPPTESAS